MPALTGKLEGGAINFSPGGISPAVDDLALPSFVGLAPRVGSVDINGGLTTSAPGVGGDAETGKYETGFYDLFYNRIHVIPAIINAGNLLSTQTRDVEVWSAFDSVSKHLTSILGSAVEGSSLVGPTSKTFAPLESYIYLLSISPTGPLSFDGSYQFIFSDAADPSVRITGRRAVVFPFPPNWAREISESLAWATTITTAKRGAESARKLRRSPRRTLGFDVLVGSGGRLAALQALLWGWQDRAYLVPVWTDATPLAEAVAAGASVIPAPVEFRDYDAGGYVVLFESPERYEVLEIESIDAGSGEIVPVISPSLSWSAGRTRVLPGRLGFLPPETNWTEQTATIESASVEFTIRDDQVSTNRIDQTAPATTYKGFEVYLRRPRAEDPRGSNRRDQAVLSTPFGVYGVRGRAAGPVRSVDFPLGYLKDREEIAEVFGFLERRAGRFSKFWAPTWTKDLELVADVTSTGVVLTIKNIGYAAMYLDADGAPVQARRDLAFFKPDGTVLFRRITAAASSGDFETLTIDSAFGEAVGPDTFKTISFLRFCRLDADRVEFSWHTAEIAEATLRFAELLTTPS